TLELCPESRGIRCAKQIADVALACGRTALAYWLFPGDAKIERHVPALPFSREVERLYGLRRALAIYRMVFGQSRQEDLITYLLAQIPEKDRDAIVAELQIDLSPASRADRGIEDDASYTGAGCDLADAEV